MKFWIVLIVNVISNLIRITKRKHRDNFETIDNNEFISLKWLLEASQLYLINYESATTEWDGRIIEQQNRNDKRLWNLQFVVERDCSSGTWTLKDSFISCGNDKYCGQNLLKVFFCSTIRKVLTVDRMKKIKECQNVNTK